MGLRDRAAPRSDQAVNTTREETVKTEAAKIGFDAVGIAAAGPGPNDGGHLRRYLAEGRHGAMDWMAETEARRADPRVLWPEARSVIVLGMSYAPEDDPLAAQARTDRGVISVYARHKDYHDVLKKRLKQLARRLVALYDCDVKVFTDTAPVMESPLAARSGLGWLGKHTNLVSRTHGSWLFLGEVFTTLELEPDRPEADHCGSCTRCLDICPTAAFTGPREIDARRCISYLTIEHDGPIPEDLRPLIGNRIYGCDDCLAVCPWNKFAHPTPHEVFRPRPGMEAPSLAGLAALDDAAFRETFRGSPVKRIGRDRMVRNVLIAIGNGGDRGMMPLVRALTRDPAAQVRDAAEWALTRLEEGER